MRLPRLPRQDRGRQPQALQRLRVRALLWANVPARALRGGAQGGVQGGAQGEAACVEEEYDKFLRQEWQGQGDPW